MNNRNDPLADVLETFQHDLGRLTDADRNIPETDIASIRNSAWSPGDTPLLRSENTTVAEIMRNNYVDIKENVLKHKMFEEHIDSHGTVRGFHTMSRRSRSASSDIRRLPKRQCTPRQSLNEDPSSSAGLHYMYHDELALGMDQMTVTQRDISENEDEEEYEVSSSSSSPASSSSSEYKPGPSARFDNNANSGESPQVERRLRKKQKMQMTQQQLDKRRKEANKKNSKNYNKNKKMREENLKKELAKKKETIKKLIECNSATELELFKCYASARRFIIIPSHGIFSISEEGYRTKRRNLDMQFDNLKKSDTDLKKLYQCLCERKWYFESADRDIRTKRENTNTYGSRKSRALHSMNIAKYEYKTASLEFEVRKQNECKNLLNTSKQELSRVFTWGNVPQEKYNQMPPETIRDMDLLMAFLML